MATSAEERGGRAGLDFGRATTHSPNGGETKPTERGPVFMENGKIMVDTTKVDGRVLRWLLIAGVALPTGVVIIDGISKLVR